MVRTPSFDKNGIKKGAWSPEEDAKLEAYITRFGTWNWRELPKFAGLKRCGKSCRLRWMNYLRSDVKRGNYSKSEEDLIMELHGKHGNKWAMIALNLPGRTDNEIKNHWHTHLKKRWGAQTSNTSMSQVSLSGSENSSHLEKYQKQGSSAGCDSSTSNRAIYEDIFQHIRILESCPLPPAPPASSVAISLSSSTNSTGGMIVQDVISSPADCFFPDSTSLIYPMGDNASNTATELMAPESADRSMKGIIEELENIDDYGDDFWTKLFEIEEAEELSFYNESSFSNQNSTSVENDELMLASSYMSHHDESIVGLYWDQTMQEEVYPWIIN